MRHERMQYAVDDILKRRAVDISPRAEFLPNLYLIKPTCVQISAHAASFF